jgi:hypothetical protein
MALRTIEVNTKVEFDDLRAKEIAADDYLYLCKYDKTIRLSDNGKLIVFMSDYYQKQNADEVAVGELLGNITYQRTITITREMLDAAIPVNKDSYNSQVVIVLDDAPADAVNAWIHDGFITRTIDDEKFNFPIGGVESTISVSKDCTKISIDYVTTIFSSVDEIVLNIRYIKQS